MAPGDHTLRKTQIRHNQETLPASNFIQDVAHNLQPGWKEILLRGCLRITFELRGKRWGLTNLLHHIKERGGGGLKLPRSRERNLYTAPKHSA